MKIKKLLIGLVLCSLFTSCVTNIDVKDINTDLTLGTSLALPIGSVHTNMMYLLNFVDSTYVQADSTNAICLLYNQQNIKLNLDLDTSFRKGEYLIDTLILKEQPSFNKLFEILPPEIESIPLPAGYYKFEKRTKYDLNFNRYKEDEIVQIDSARFKHANVDFKIKISGFEMSEENFLILSFNYPSLFEKEYEYLFENIRITTNEYVFSEKLGHFMAHLNNSEEGNLIDLVINFEFVSSGTGTISKDAKLIFETEMNLINTEEVYGFVWYRDPIDAGKITYDIPQDIFQNELLAKNNLLFANPQINLKTTTNAGLPLQLTVNDFYATKGSRIEYASFYGEDTAIEYLNIPKVPFDSATTTITLNREYGSLHTLISMLPETINFDYKVTTPEKEKIENKPHFLTIPVLAKLDVQAKLPLQFDPTTSFTYKDTLDADISSLLGSSLEMIDIDTICIYLDVNSSLPVNASLTLNYLNENNEVLITSKTFTIPSALVNEEGRVITPSEKTLVLATSGKSIEDVYNTKKIILEISIEGYDENSRIYFETTNAIDIKVSAFAKAKADFSLTDNNN